MGLPRSVPAGGITIGDRTFTEGTILSVNPWVIHRSPEIWGSDARIFVPERWLRDDAADLEKKQFIPVSMLMALLCFDSRDKTDSGCFGSSAQDIIHVLGTTLLRWSSPKSLRPFYETTISSSWMKLANGIGGRTLLLFRKAGPFM